MSKKNKQRAIQTDLERLFKQADIDFIELDTLFEKYEDEKSKTNLQSLRQQILRIQKHRQTLRQYLQDGILQASEDKMKSYVLKIEAYMNKYKFFERGDGESANEIWITQCIQKMQQAIDNLKNMSGKKAKKIDAEGHIENYKQHLEIFEKIKDKIRKNELEQDVIDQIEEQINDFVEQIQDKIEMCDLNYLYEDSEEDNYEDYYNNNNDQQEKVEEEINEQEEEQQEQQQEQEQNQEPQQSQQKEKQEIQQQEKKEEKKEQQEPIQEQKQEIKQEIKQEPKPQVVIPQIQVQQQPPKQQEVKIEKQQIQQQIQPKIVLQPQIQIQQKPIIQQQQIQIQAKKPEPQIQYKLQDKPSNSYHFSTVASSDKPKPRFELMSSPINQMKEIQKRYMVQQPQIESYSQFFDLNLIKLYSECPFLQQRTTQQLKVTQILYHQPSHLQRQVNINFEFDQNLVENAEQLNSQLQEIYKNRQPIQYMSINKKEVSVSSSQQLQLNIEYFKSQQVATLLFIVYHVNDTVIVNAAIEALRLRNFYFDSSIMKFVLKQSNQFYWYNYNTGLIMIRDE